MDRCARIVRSCYEAVRVRPNAIRLTLTHGVTSFYRLSAGDRKYLQRHGDMKAVDYAVACFVRYYRPSPERFIPTGAPREDPILVPQIEPTAARGPTVIHSPREAWTTPVEALWQGPLPRPAENPFPAYHPPTTALQHLAIRLAALATTTAPFHDPDEAIYLFHHS